MKPIENRSITNNTNLDYFLIYCPLWFPLLYLLLISNFPLVSPIIFLAAIFLFAETHFASTWLFFIDKENHLWIKDNLYKLVLLPIYILFLITVLWFFNPSLVLIIHYLASGFHVTRQSVGITKLAKIYTKLNEFIIYIISGLCLAIGLINPGLLARNLSIENMNLVLLIIGIFYLFISKYSSKSLKNLIPIFTGLSIYLPLLFFKNLGVATVIGVGMHWCQYIILMFFINFRKNKKYNPKKTSTFYLKNRIGFVFFYSLIMTTFTFLGMPKDNISLNTYSFFYLIPLLFQLYHFYIDGFIWKFSDKHIRESVSKYIYKH